jgi:hypothetical protein
VWRPPPARNSYARDREGRLRKRKRTVWTSLSTSDCAPLSIQIREAAGFKLPPGARVGGRLSSMPSNCAYRHRDFVLSRNWSPLQAEPDGSSHLPSGWMAHFARPMQYWLQVGSSQRTRSAVLGGFNRVDVRVVRRRPSGINPNTHLGISSSDDRDRMCKVRYAPPNAVC